MAWYWILAIVVASIVGLFAILFTVYITNSDMKLVQVLYNKVIGYHDKKEVEEKL